MRVTASGWWLGRGTAVTFVHRACGRPESILTSSVAVSRAPVLGCACVSYAGLGTGRTLKDPGWMQKAEVSV